MKILFLVIEFLSAAILIGAILLHSPKGEGLGGIGGQARMFSAQRGLEAGLDRFTAVVATIFMISALALGVFIR